MRAAPPAIAVRAKRGAFRKEFVPAQHNGSTGFETLCTILVPMPSFLPILRMP